MQDSSQVNNLHCHPEACHQYSLSLCRKREAMEPSCSMKELNGWEKKSQQQQHSDDLNPPAGEDGTTVKAASSTMNDNSGTGYQRTPMHVSEAKMSNTSSSSSASSVRQAAGLGLPEEKTVSCNACRPTGRERISIVPVEANKSGGDGRSGLNGPGTNVFKSLLFSIAKKSPRWNVGCDYSPSSSPSTNDIAELTQKLAAANRRRDEALGEVSRLRTSMGELERKLGKLEVYCHDLKKALDARVAEETSGVMDKDKEPSIKYKKQQTNPIPILGLREAEAARTVEAFLQAVSDSRTCVRHLGKALAVHLNQMGNKAFDRLTTLLSPYDVRVSAKSSRAIVFYLEALMSRALHEDFESPAFERSSTDGLLNPMERCRVNLEAYSALKGLSWEEVLGKGTRRFSESFSRFCDQKMSVVVAMLGWSKAWPEPLLQAFFGAAKHVWLVHLLAFSLHPSLPIFWVEKGTEFDGIYMEDLAGEKLLLRKNSGAAMNTGAVVGIMVSPGFYVHSNVVKCKVLCRYPQQQTATRSIDDLHR